MEYDILNEVLASKKGGINFHVLKEIAYTTQLLYVILTSSEAN